MGALVRIAEIPVEKDSMELFKISLELWAWLTKSLYEEQRAQGAQAGGYGGFGGSQGVLQLAPIGGGAAQVRTMLLLLLLLLVSCCSSCCPPASFSMMTPHTCFKSPRALRCTRRSYTACGR